MTCSVSSSSQLEIDNPYVTEDEFVEKRLSVRAFDTKAMHAGPGIRSWSSRSRNPSRLAAVPLPMACLWHFSSRRLRARTISVTDLFSDLVDGESLQMHQQSCTRRDAS